MALKAKQFPITFDPLPEGLSALSADLFQESLPTAVVFLLSRLDGLLEDVLQSWLHEEEITQLTQYRHPKRYREFLGGRLCAKEGLSLFLEQQHYSFPFMRHQCRVAAAESGRPYFLTALQDESAYPVPQLSISHSGEFATALISHTPCGIDIQYMADSLTRVKERFCTAQEEQTLKETLPRLSALSQLALLWAGKEALKKMLSSQTMPGFHDLILHDLSPQNAEKMVLYFSRPDSSGSLFPVAAGTANNNYAIALCCTK